MLDGNEKNGRPCRTTFELGFSTLPCLPFEVASASEDRIEQAAESKEVREVLWSRKSFVVWTQNRRCPDWSTIYARDFQAVFLSVKTIRTTLLFRVPHQFRLNLHGIA